jgi:hypothetical protein
MSEPDLYEMCNDKFLLVQHVRERDAQLDFRRWLNNDIRSNWDKIMEKFQDFEFQEIGDCVSWKWGKNKEFSVKSLYDNITSITYGPYLKHIWKGKIPPKIKIFMWLLENNVLLTKENMVRRNWNGNTSCGFCDEFESTTHLFFNCHISAGFGLSIIWVMSKILVLFVLLPFVGPFGKLEIMCAFKTLWSTLLSKLYVMLVY